MIFRKLLPQLLLAGVFMALTLLQQYAFYALKELPIIPLSAGKYFGVFLFFFLLTFIKGPRLRFALLSMVMVLNTFQMGHLSYFGTQVLPSEIYLLFTQFHEISGTLKEDLRHVFVPLLFTLVPVALGFLAHRRLKISYGHWSIAVLVFLYLLYNPVRTYVTGNTWGRQPSTRELTGMNVYLTMSYFFGRILPHKLGQDAGGGSENSSSRLALEAKHEPHWDKIILVLGESLTPRHMQLFGYERPTTPFLDSLKGKPNFFHTVGLSGGVSTDIAVAYFMNLGFGSAGSLKAAKGDQCLFRLAKSRGYKTHFLSIQSGEQLRYISPYLCAGALDEFRSLEDVSPNTVDHQAARDRDLLLHLKTYLTQPEKKFLMLHQRGSHSPWNLRYSEEARKFTGANDLRIDDYDNSVLEFDLFWKELHDLLKESKEKILVLYLSDHGESLGHDGKWGHGFIGPVSFEVPILMFSVNAELPSATKKLPKYLTHYNLGLLLSRELGFEPNQPVEILPSDYEVFGNDIDGFAGRAKIKFNESDYSLEHLP